MYFAAVRFSHACESTIRARLMKIMPFTKNCQAPLHLRCLLQTGDKEKRK